MKHVKYHVVALTITLIMVAFNFTPLGWMRSVPLAVGKVTGQICRWGGCTSVAAYAVTYEHGRTVSYCSEHVGSAPDSISTEFLDGTPIFTAIITALGLCGYYLGVKEFMQETSIHVERFGGSLIFLIIAGVAASLAPWITILV